ncbi:RimJ/RimL family protein N-acetyltransferase [Kibdelosporangium banguiense]|uniref:RimJ/RimL family protein N-acetyltransferase n=1 Tax=Kibdelosporangium banguiense TaxID=1365924 RepID=A0ABS4TNP2_9PSEU|nr:GNAT family protein [Kibdelosporangium banguiense]MBP2325511.1 RimJ/RimL family protein N-acetyltransferase [Kibdelosporangium banguiense]
MIINPLRPDLVGRKVLLREVGPADRRTLAGFDRDSSPQTGGYRHWAAHRASSADTGDDLRFAIETLHSRIVVGSMSTIQAPGPDQFSYGIGIGPQHRCCGYAADAVVVLLGFMFGQRGYRKCEVIIHGGNLASLALHGSLGFREEDRLRDTYLLRGKIKYPVMMSITAGEFAALRPDAQDLPRRGRHWRNRRGRHWS